MPKSTNAGPAQKGVENQAISHSRCGLTTKIGALVDALGNLIAFVLVPGQRHDVVHVVHVASLGRKVSAIGFGCASLGSRISATDGGRALDQAFDLRVWWYDVAPSYGDGQAEILLGEFPKGLREKVVVCTKFGIARPNISRTKQLLRPLARLTAETFPVRRSTVSRVRATDNAPRSLRRRSSRH